mmetsp:Transcript_10579/g.12001  ORF Transcript_10579/g.12001 Transcript_10579/m.12001 type:complete len:158 (-) Transcript_10579:65-538(-)
MLMPDKIRVVIDQTAKYVAAKNGNRNHSRLEFEARIMKKQKKKKKGKKNTHSTNNDNTNKFDFLQTTSPFHEYYEGRIKYFENILTPTPTPTAATATATAMKTKTKKRHSEEQSTITTSSAAASTPTSEFEKNNHKNNKWKNWKNDGDSTNNKRMKV